MERVAAGLTDASVDELSALFGVDINKNLDADKSSDYGIPSNSGSLRPFVDRCEDVKCIMEEEPVTENKSESEPEPEPEPQTKEPALSEDGSSSSNAEVKNMSTNDNPLELTGDNLRAYHDIKKNFPQFQLYDGSQAFQDFYRHKVKQLKGLLASFPLLDIDDMQKEIEATNVNYKLGTNPSDPSEIYNKLAESFAPKPRLTALLSRAQRQLPAWKKISEMLSSKLYRDHELKGAHKRMALDLEHMDDITLYVARVQGFVDSVNTIDNLLKAAFEGLSRQLACIVTREKAGLAHEKTEKELDQVVEIKQSSSLPEDRELDGLDTVAAGTVIPKSTTEKALVEKDFGGAEIEDSLLQNIG